MSIATNDFTGHTYVITGGASGLGLESARHLARRGANLVLADLDAGGLARAASELPAGRACTIVSDVRKPADCEAMMRLATERYGALDGAVCSAGIDTVTPALETTLEVWHAAGAADASAENDSEPRGADVDKGVNAASTNAISTLDSRIGYPI